VHAHSGTILLIGCSCARKLWVRGRGVRILSFLSTFLSNPEHGVDILTAYAGCLLGVVACFNGDFRFILTDYSSPPDFLLTIGIVFHQFSILHQCSYPQKLLCPSIIKAFVSLIMQHIYKESDILTY
jgi:hypothetical protein